jgi:hypothetical protein
MEERFVEAAIGIALVIIATILIAGITRVVISNTQR